MNRRLYSILGNSQKLDGGAMFGNAPRALWERWAAPDARNRIDLACRALLIREPNLNILLETGIGASLEPKLKDRYGVQEADHVLLSSLAKIGLSHEDIDVVVLSHLHFDHAGGMLSAWGPKQAHQLLFPNATIIVGSEAWERACTPHPRDKASFIPELQVLLELTTAHLSGGDVPAAITQLEAAGELARSHGADRDSLRVAAMLGQLRLVQGMQRHARPHLEQAVDLAQRLEDDLSLLSNATLLSGIQLGAGEWALAEATAALQLPAAVRRHNWMAVADGAITKSTCALGRGDPPSSVSLLVQCSQQMRGRAPAAAIRLVQARLAELRGTIGDAIFDPLLTSALSPQE